MRRRPPVRLPAVLACAAALALGGCFTLDAEIEVRPDGSGTVSETVRLTGIARVFLPRDTAAAVYDDERLQARADALGAQLASVEPRGRDGYRAVFAFADINQLVYTLGRDAVAVGGADSADVPPEALAFAFAQEADSLGGGAVLQVFGPGAAAAPEAGALAPLSPRALARVQSSLSALRFAFEEADVRVALRVAGAVAETDATHADGAALVLAHVRLADVLDHLDARPEAAERLGFGTAPSATAAADLLARDDLPGITVERQEAVTVRYRGP